MSDREFENYLTLLAGLLRLNGKQREAIADELRSHLEDRLEELIASGISRDEAIQQALAEFGDAAGLARQFGAISQNRKRWWLMRMTTFSVAAMVLVAASLAIFWPGRNAAPGVAAVIAQAPKAADPFGAPAPAPAAKQAARVHAPAVGTGATAKIEQELNKATNLECVEMPLKDVVAYLQEMHQIPMRLNIKKLDEVSVPIDTPVTKTLRGITLRSALNLLLGDLDLTYVVRDEVLQITTPGDAQATTEIRIYDCRDILAMPAPHDDRAFAGAAGAAPGAGVPGGDAGFSGRGGFSDHDRRAAQLMTIITTNVDPQTWQNAVVNGRQNSGSGSISEYNGLIVVTQTPQTHTKIEHVLDMLREAAGLEAPKNGKVVR